MISKKDQAEIYNESTTIQVSYIKFFFQLRKFQNKKQLIMSYSSIDDLISHFEGSENINNEQVVFDIHL